MSKILIYAGSCAIKHYSFIAPMRIARACHRHGDEVRLINWADDRVDGKDLVIGQQNLKWGMCWTLSLSHMLSTLIEQLETWKPDVIYSMGTTQIQALIRLSKRYEVPLGIHVGDPYYSAYPTQSTVNNYKLADFITFNEGQAWNYIRKTHPEIAEKCYLLNHAIDPELSPTWEEVQKVDKKYIVSCVGGDDRIRRKELVTYYYQWTTDFPDAKFATGGSLVKGVTAPYTEKDLNPKIKEAGRGWNHTTFTEEEVKKYEGKLFNVNWIPNDLNYPLGLSHEAVHKLYSESYYAFTPYGHYIREGKQSGFNVMTFGTKIFEQGGSGCAMISNRVKDIEQLIIHGVTGFILDTPEDAKKAFQFAIDHPEKVRQMGLNAYKFIHMFHSWDNRYKEVLLPIFQKLGIKK